MDICTYIYIYGYIYMDTYVRAFWAQETQITFHQKCVSSEVAKLTWADRSKEQRMKVSVWECLHSFFLFM